MAESSPPTGSAADCMNQISSTLSALYTLSNANDVTALNNHAILDCFSDSDTSSVDSSPLEPLSSDDDDDATNDTSRPSAMDLCGPSSYALAMRMPTVDGRNVMDLLSGLHPENRERAVELFDHYCAIGARILAREEQVKRAADALKEATAAMAAATAEGALAAQASALLELERDRCGQVTGRGTPCSRLWRSCPFVRHAAARQAAGLPCAAPVPCAQHWRYRQESCDKCFRRRRLRVLRTLLTPLK